MKEDEKYHTDIILYWQSVGLSHPVFDMLVLQCDTEKDYADSVSLKTLVRELAL